jgi:diamine N-acetyltransferase
MKPHAMDAATWPISLSGNYLRSTYPEFAQMIEEPFLQAQHATGRTLSRESHVTLRDVTETNLRMVCQLDVNDSQRNLVAPNAVSIAQAHYSPYAWIRAVYADEMPVGFIMLYDPTLAPPRENMAAAPDEIYVWRFMIDHRHQRMRFGERAFGLAINHAKSRPGIVKMSLTFVPVEGNAEPMYQRFGFARTGKIDDGEVVMAMQW